MICPICGKNTLIKTPMWSACNTDEHWVLTYCSDIKCGYREHIDYVNRSENTAISERKLEEENLK